MTDDLPPIQEITRERVLDIQKTAAGKQAADNALEFERLKQAKGEDVHFFVCGPVLFAGSKPKETGHG